MDEDKVIQKIEDMRVDIAKIGGKQDSLTTAVNDAFTRFQVCLNDHEARIRTLEDITKALGQIEGLRTEVECLKKEVQTLKSSETVRTWWDSKKDLIIPGLVIAGVSLLAGILIARWS